MRNRLFYAACYLILLLLMTCFRVDSATVVVRQDGQGGAYTTIQEAYDYAKSMQMELIEIQQHTAPFVIDMEDENGLQLDNIGIFCSTENPAVLDCQDFYGIGNANNVTLRNLHLIGNREGWQTGIKCGPGMVIDNCIVESFQEQGIWFLTTDGGPISGSISNSYFINSKIQIGSFENSSAVGEILFDHCTFYDDRGGNPNINLEESFALAGLDGSNIEVKNSILRTETAANVFAYYNSAANPLAYTHSYNDYIHGWQREVWDSGNAGPQPLGIGDKENVAPDFVDAANGDFSLASTSKLLKAGEGGTNIGAWQGGGFPPGDVIVRQDGQGGAYTTLQEAVIYTLSGQTIEIQQHTAPFVIDMEDENGLQLDNIGIFCSTENPAVLDCQDFYGIGNANNVTLRNLHLIGNREGWQTGIKCGPGMVIDNCIVESFQEQGIWFLTTDGGPISGSISNSYFINSKIQIGSFENSSAVGEILFDHCTFYDDRGGNPNINLEESFALAGLDGSNIEVKNSILRTETAANVFAYYNSAANPLAYTHSYNDYIHGWQREVWDSGNAGPQPPGAGDVENIDPLFTNAPGGDLSLLDTSPVATSAEGGTTIGAYQVEPSSIEDWSLY